MNWDSSYRSINISYHMNWDINCSFVSKIGGLFHFCGKNCGVSWAEAGPIGHLVG